MTLRIKLLLFSIPLVMCYGVSTAVTVPKGFVVEPLVLESEWTPGHGWPVRRLEAVRNPDYGAGVISASINNNITDNGILEVMLISNSTVEIINSQSGFSTPSGVGDIRFDTSGLFGGYLFMTVWTDTEASESDWMQSFSTLLMQVPPDSNSIDEVGYYQGDINDRLLFMLDFTPDVNDYDGGCYFADYAVHGGTSFYRLDPADMDNPIDLTFDVLPVDPCDTEPNRTDLDPRGMEFDRTDNYNSYLTIADSEWNTDRKSAIYQLEPNCPDPNYPCHAPDFIWSTVAGPNSIDGPNSISFRDMCYDPGNGRFGGALYVTEYFSDSVMIVEPNGMYKQFASGFNEIQSITIDESGGYMYVSDQDAIYRIWMPGPTILMQEPKTVNDGVFTDTNGIPALRLLWSEPVTFQSEDVSVTYMQDELVQQINAPSLSGSGTDIMTINFQSPLLYNRFTVTIADTVLSDKNNIPIDGDADGFTGGNAVIVLEHSLRADLDDNNVINLCDLAILAEKWMWVWPPE